MILRPYQSRLVSKAFIALEARGNTLAVAATGAGKTVCLSALAKKVGGKTLVLQHRGELVTQNMRKFKQVNPDATCTLFTASKKSFRGDATFAMVQSLVRHLDSIPKLDLLIADEAHHCTSPSWLSIIEKAEEINPDVKIVGFTATPERSDKKGLRKVFDNICDTIPTSELVKLGYLVPPKTFIQNIPEVVEKLKKVQNQSEFGDQSEVADILDTEVVHQEVIRHWKEKAQDRPTVVFAATVEHAGNVAQAFIEAGVPAECIHGGLSVTERNAILKRITSGETKVITNCMVLTEGWDFPPVSCVILLRKCSSKGAMVQMIGRGLRTVNPQEFPGIVKKDCIVIDFGMSIATHGTIDVDAKLDDYLIGGDEEEGEPLTKECPIPSGGCGALVPLGTRKCPFCGYEFPPSEDALELSHVELTEVDILAKSMWRYVDLFGSGRCFIASGFNAWAGVFSTDDDTWYAIGKPGKGCKVKLVLVGQRPQALAAADDFLRIHETEPASMKGCRWQNEPASSAQMAQLARFNVVAPMSKYEASAHLNFRFSKDAIENILGAR